MKIQIARSRALSRINSDYYLRQIHACIPDELASIIRTAFRQPGAEDMSRWAVYEQLKQQYLEAIKSHREIWSNSHYEVMMDFIDYILPQEAVLPIESYVRSGYVVEGEAQR